MYIRMYMMQHMVLYYICTGIACLCTYIYGIETRSFKVLTFTLKIRHPSCTHFSFETIRAGMKTSVKGDEHLDYWTIKCIRAKVNCCRRLQKSSTFVIVANSCCIYRCNKHWSLTASIAFTNACSVIWWFIRRLIWFVPFVKAVGTDLH